MASSKDREARRFERVAIQRMGEAKFLIRHKYTTASVYLAGYGVECMLKSLILGSEPPSLHSATLQSFRTSKAHDFEWLRRHLKSRNVTVPTLIVKSLTRINWWSTSMRYDPRIIKLREAQTFLYDAGEVVRWAEGRL